MSIYLDANFVKAQIGKLLADFPELEEDETLRLDMVEAETDASKVLARLLDGVRNDETMRDAVKARADEIYSRAARYERSSEAKRRLMKSIMQAAEVNRVVLPEATLTIARPLRSVEIISLEDIPQGYAKIEKKADKSAIKKALEAGDEIPGAALRTGDPYLVVSKK